ncbi:MAG: hypothetical protein JWQ14_1034, partial [Adhaeribacter sp.]|nr:hypothetical protein [Adhaeribacter sp.]
MNDQKSSTPTDKVRMDEFVAKVIPEPGNYQAMTLLQGFVGGSSRENYIRVYSDPSLNSYLEIRLDAVVHAQPLTAEESPLGGSYLWVRKEAEFTYGAPTAQQQTKSSFLEGDFYNNYVITYGYNQESEMANQAAGANALAATLTSPCIRVSILTPCITFNNRPPCNIFTRYNITPCRPVITQRNIPPCNLVTFTSRCCPITPTTPYTITPTTPTPTTPTFTPTNPTPRIPGQPGFEATAGGAFN